jgi:hypothetical protein
MTAGIEEAGACAAAVESRRPACRTYTAFSNSLSSKA